MAVYCDAASGHKDVAGRSMEKRGLKQMELSEGGALREERLAAPQCGKALP
jgi:hypothetical protein